VSVSARVLVIDGAAAGLQALLLVGAHDRLALVVKPAASKARYPEKV
jgi:hypothetical protein